MLRLYSDENFPLEIVRQLRLIQYDVLTSYEAGQAQILYSCLSENPDFANRLIRI
ncbi:hypothetical protein ACSQ6I_18605 [Anabaena sp. WFMT]|uniref:hypothetical protein n=1 Tax=Anabaena sp. WFMT TaxID=3449730 RepID=UPI003F2145A6